MSLQEAGLATDEEVFVDELKPGTELMHGQYTIEGFLAAGGFGITYLARDSLNRRMVIKECFPGSLCRRRNCSVTPRSRAHQNELKSIVRLFSQEAMSLAKANHPNIVGVHQVFEENNTAYMALDFVQGRDLLEILEDDPETLEPALVEGYLTKVLDAIKHIHQLGILHRDISPDNIIINEQNEPILIDFGAARESENEKATRMLSALRVVKDGYSPQEFYIAGSDQTPSCDLYSLAASFYHLITKELPPDSQWRLSACAAGDDDPYVSLGEKTDAYSTNFVTALDKAIAILPRDRMQNAEEWIAHMTSAAPVVSEITSSRADFVAATGKKPFLPILLATTALAAAAGVGFLFISSGDPIASPETEAGGEVDVSVGSNASAAEPTPAVVPVVPAPVAETASAAPAPAVIPAPPAASNVEETPTPVETIAVVPAIPTEPVEIAPVAPVQTTEAPTDPTPAPVEAVRDGPPVVIAAIRPVPNPVNTTTEAGIVEISGPDFTGLATNVAALSPPEAGDAVNFTAPSVLLGLPEQSRGLQVLESAALALQDTNPTIDTVAPAALILASPAADQSLGQAEAEAEGTGVGVDFFVAMAAKQPELVTAPSTRSTAATTLARVAPVQNVEVADNAAVQTRVVPYLPFSLSLLEPGLIVSVTDGAPDWLADARIVSVNGQPITTNDQITTSLQAAAATENAGTFNVSLGIDAGVDGAVSERTLALATELHTDLQNGLSFVSRQTGSVWTTQVSSIPNASNFQVGDTIMSYILTWENVDGPSSMKTILDRELANGTSNFSFAVNRGSEIWIADFDLASAN